MLCYVISYIILYIILYYNISYYIKIYHIILYYINNICIHTCVCVKAAREIMYLRNTHTRLSDALCNLCQAHCDV